MDEFGVLRQCGAQIEQRGVAVHAIDFALGEDGFARIAPARVGEQAVDPVVYGFVHGGVVGMIADSAAGYAAMTVVPESASVLTVEFKMNLVAPADGEKLIARGKVVRPGKTLIITQAEVFAVKDGRESLCALMQQTIMVMHGKTEK